MSVYIDDIIAKQAHYTVIKYILLCLNKHEFELLFGLS